MGEKEIVIKNKDMKISGFTMLRNAVKLYYPIKEVIASVLPLVDEFVVALGESDADDTSKEIITSIGDPKIRIIETVWDLKRYPNGMENAHQTDIAKSHCSGDWLFYLQADEVVHEKYLPVIRKRCEELLHDSRVEALLFKYTHFWGDYEHYHEGHNWYKKEIRIIRNDPDIHSWQSAQSFRRIPHFDGISYRQEKNTFKLHVAELDAEIFHYGWVRPPQLMMAKKKALDIIHKGKEEVEKLEKEGRYVFDYGPLNRLKVFKDTHPEVMKDWIKKCNWKEELQYSGKPSKQRKKHKHEKLKYRILSWIENKPFKGRVLFGGNNYIVIK
jgi:hypothetical protein